jgi:hypothetical protein
MVYGFFYEAAGVGRKYQNEKEIDVLFEAHSPGKSNKCIPTITDKS